MLKSTIFEFLVQLFSLFKPLSGGRINYISSTTRGWQSALGSDTANVVGTCKATKNLKK